jgi:endo-1,4-beta-xylanase
MKKLILCLFLVVLVGCKKKVSPTCNDSAGLYTIAKYPIGAAIDFNEFISNSVYRSIAVKQFNSFTPENIFKAEYLHPEENRFEWLDADSLANFCLANRIRLHGHVLVWHQQLPQWILSYTGNTAAWDTLLKIHIETIVRHFKGRVKAWDVVNEAFNEDGTLRNSIWRQKLGDSYIEKAFVYAHEADPDAMLFYSDYNLESNPDKRNSALSLLNHLRDRGIRIDGISLQMHISIQYSEASQIAEALRQIANNHFKLHLSELDISVNADNKHGSPNASLFNRQADLLGQIIEAYNQLPKEYQYGITFWGISDRNSWIRSYYHRQDYPLLYDDNYLPKPAYCKLQNVL